MSTCKGLKNKHAHKICESESENIARRVRAHCIPAAFCKPASIREARRKFQAAASALPGETAASMHRPVASVTEAQSGCDAQW